MSKAIRIECVGPTLGGRVCIGDVSRQVLSLGIDVPSSVLAFSVVRALTGSPGLVRLESTGLMEHGIHP